MDNYLSYWANLTRKYLSIKAAEEVQHIGKIKNASSRILTNLRSFTLIACSLCSKLNRRSSTINFIFQLFPTIDPQSERYKPEPDLCFQEFSCEFLWSLSKGEKLFWQKTKQNKFPFHFSRALFFAFFFLILKYVRKSCMCDAIWTTSSWMLVNVSVFSRRNKIF